MSVDLTAPAELFKSLRKTLCFHSEDAVEIHKAELRESDISRDDFIPWRGREG